MEAKGSQPLGIGWYRVVREIAADRMLCSATIQFSDY